jgi:hypothetical protein
MEVNVITHRDNELIRMKNDLFMEDWSEIDFEYVPNQEPLFVQETYVPNKIGYQLVTNKYIIISTNST